MALNDGHPTAEDLAAYVDQACDAARRGEIERHLAACAACRDSVADAMAFITSEQTIPASRVTTATARAWTWRHTGAALAAAALVLLAVRLAPRLSSRADTPAADVLVAALAGEPVRPAEGRLTGFPYAPAPVAVRAGDAAVELSPPTRRAIAGLERQAIESKAPAALAALGRAYIVDGDLGAAIATLERATTEGTPDAATWNDLAVAYLARGAQRGDAADADRARAALERALALAPALPEALFNHALALDRLGRTADAIAAWRRVAALDPADPWAREADARARALTAP